MEVKDKLILNGVFTTFDTVNRSRSHFYYTKEEYKVHIDELRHKMKLKSRLEKIKKIRYGKYER